MPVSISGTAADIGGGVVGGVEISVDGGTTWRRANGRANWSYSWTPDTAGAISVLSRAADDSGNLGAATSITVNVSSNPDTTPPTVSVTSPANNATVVGSIPVTADATDNFGVVGVQFRLNGANLGLEDTAAPYEITWNTLTSANGTYALTATARDAAGNQSTSPAVNVTINNPIDTTPPTVVTVSPADGATGVALNSTVTVTFSEDMDPATITGGTFELRDGANNLVAATVTYDVPSRTATLTPTSPMVDGTLYTATVLGGATDPRAKDLAGNALAQNYVWSFLAGSAGNCPCSIWDASAVPGNPAEPDANPVEVGVKFQADLDGDITGIRFYKGAGNTGTHIGNLWTSTGQLLATATFVNETATGWQQVDFAARYRSART